MIQDKESVRGHVMTPGECLHGIAQASININTPVDEWDGSVHGGCRVERGSRSHMALDGMCWYATKEPELLIAEIVEQNGLDDKTVEFSRALGVVMSRRGWSVLDPNGDEVHIR